MLPVFFVFSAHIDRKASLLLCLKVFLMLNTTLFLFDLRPPLQVVVTKSVDMRRTKNFHRHRDHLEHLLCNVDHLLLLRLSLVLEEHFAENSFMQPNHFFTLVRNFFNSRCIFVKAKAILTKVFPGKADFKVSAVG